MRYPTIPASKVALCVETLIDDPTADVSDMVLWSGSGSDLDLTGLEAAAVELQLALDQLLADGNPDPDLFEGRVAGRLHHELTEAEVEAPILDEPSFWAALSIVYFWKFVYWREQRTFDTGDYGKYRKYVDGSNWSECVVTRTYLRGALTHRPEEADPYRLATAIPKGTDFWRSHILRVQTSMSRSLSQAFAQEQASDRMVTDQLRAYARRLNRMWSNVVLHTYDDTECESLISELR